MKKFQDFFCVSEGGKTQSLRYLKNRPHTPKKHTVNQNKLVYTITSVFHVKAEEDVRVEKILIVDDSMVQAAQLKVILEDEYDVSVAQRAEDGLRWASDENFSLILLDVVMPIGISFYTFQVILEDEYDVSIAQTAQDGLSRASREEYSLILLDVVMPGMDGFTLLKTLQEEIVTQSIPVILITSLNDALNEQRGEMAGGTPAANAFFCLHV